MQPTPQVMNCGPSDGSLEQAVSAAIRNGLAAFARWRERRALYRELSALSDDALKDIGLHRTGLRSAIEDTLGRADR